MLLTEVTEHARMSIESVMSSNQFILCRPLLLLPSIFPNIRVSSHESFFMVVNNESCFGLKAEH